MDTNAFYTDTRSNRINVVFDWFVKAMGWYEKADELATDDNEDPVLRWNACARIMKRNPSLRPRPEDHTIDEIHQDDVPVP